MAIAGENATLGDTLVIQLPDVAEAVSETLTWDVLNYTRLERCHLLRSATHALVGIPCNHNPLAR